MLPCEYVAKRSGGYQCVSKEEFAEANNAQNTLMVGFVTVVLCVLVVGLYLSRR